MMIDGLNSSYNEFCKSQKDCKHCKYRYARPCQLAFGYDKALDDVFKVLLDSTDTEYTEKYIYSGTIVEVLKQLRKGEDETIKKVYISGKITGTKDYMERFAECEKKLTEQGYSVINPAKVNAMLPQGTEYDEYMKMSFTMLEMCDMIYMMNGWSTSNGACMEYDRAKELGKEIMLE